MNKKEPIQVNYDNLAMPEIHLGKKEPAKETQDTNKISYESLAITEIHLHKRKKK